MGKISDQNTELAEEDLAKVVKVLVNKLDKIENKNTLNEPYSSLLKTLAPNTFEIRFFLQRAQAFTCETFSLVIKHIQHVPYVQEALHQLDRLAVARYEIVGYVIHNHGDFYPASYYKAILENADKAEQIALYLSQFRTMKLYNVFSEKKFQFFCKDPANFASLVPLIPHEKDFMNFQTTVILLSQSYRNNGLFRRIPEPILKQIAMCNKGELPEKYQNEVLKRHWKPSQEEAPTLILHKSPK
ncbi:MAG: hypothetical protein EPO11_06545 [Gammaproteobacteria bacterium]|nr:MAG: hypothetical protein EPO11_06545 [Gammaproteobacteria bacterium]